MVSLGSRSILVDDCSDSVGTSVDCKSHSADDPACATRSSNWLRMNLGTDGGAIFQRETCVEHTTLIIDECVRTYK